MRRFPRTNVSRLLATILLFFFISSTPVLAAICCKCHPANDANTTLCLTSQQTSDCSGIITKSSNPKNLAGVTCDPTALDPKTTCQAFAQNGAGVCTQAPTEAATYATGTGATFTPIVPSLNVPIPGLQFSADVPITTEGQTQTAHIPFLAQYIAGVYKYLLGASIIAASVMIVYGGFLYIIGSTLTSVTRGKEVIKDALIGLLLVFGTYTILKTINPDTLTLEAVNVQIIPSVYPDVDIVPIDYSEYPPGQPPSPGTPGGAPPAPQPGQPPAPQPGQPPAPQPGQPPAPQPGQPPAPVIGSFTLPPTPGSKGWIKDGNCDFELNQAGIPTLLSSYKCAIETVAKEQGIHACYLITSFGKETYIGLTNIVGHDENPTQKITTNGVEDYFPERKKFLNSGKSYLAVNGKGGFTFTPLSENPDLVETRSNDDRVDLTKPDLGLDKRFSHGFGIGLTKVPLGCPIDPDKRTWIQPYGSLKGAAQWIKCVLDGQLHALDYQTYTGTVYNLYSYWGGCGSPGYPKCGGFPKDFNNPLPVRKGTYDKRGGYSYLTSECLKAENPWTTISKFQFTICRGDLPLDREACKAYVTENLQNLGVSPMTACDRKSPITNCTDSKMPVKCVPHTNCMQLQINPNLSHG